MGESVRVFAVPRLVVGLVLLAAAGCDQGPITIEERRVCPQPRAVGLPTSEDRFRPGAMLDQQQPPVAPPGPGANGPNAPTGPGPSGVAPAFRWQIPPGWQELPATDLRLINLGAPGGVECYVSVLGGGGGLLSNVNRWRSQIGAPPLDQAGLEALPHRTLLGRPAVYVELTGTYQGPGDQPRPDWALLGLLQEGQGSLLAVKLIGPAAAATAQREGLEQFCASLRIETP